MGLFSGRGNPALAQYAGMHLEVMDREGRLLFVAYAAVSRGSMTLKPLTNVNLREDVKEIKALLRGYNEETVKPVYLECVIRERRNGNWFTMDVKPAEYISDRSFHREDVRAVGEVMPMRQNDIEREKCMIINISAHGVAIRTQGVFRPGDRLLLISSLLKEWSVTPLLCAVRRVAKKGIEYEYGCEFVDLTEQTERIIMQAVQEIESRRIRYAMEMAEREQKGVHESFTKR
ncbi:MAG: PilZ domain-containing protein [Oscillospiraceae bacterium]|nr:PilZ domain-containing protein [Oscillospiraceae bacterium]